MDKYQSDDVVHSASGRTFRVLWTTKRNSNKAQQELWVRDNYTRKCLKLPTHRITEHYRNGEKV